MSLTLHRFLKRRTCGGFWAGALAQRGIVSPIAVAEEVVIAQECYEHTVAQYWYEALGLAVSEVAFEVVTGGAWRAQVPAFLDRKTIDTLVQFHRVVVQETVGSVLGRKLIETEMREQRAFLQTLADVCQRSMHSLSITTLLFLLFLLFFLRAVCSPVSMMEGRKTEWGVCWVAGCTQRTGVKVLLEESSVPLPLSSQTMMCTHLWQISCAG